MPDKLTSPQSRRELARALTRVSRASTAELLALEGDTPSDPPWTIAVTGPAGVGKSTLVSRLAPYRLARLKAATARQENLLAVLAIDPTSPVSGGAILGDRIRMDDIAGDPAVFLRSLASGGSYQGLSRNIVNVLSVTQGFGFDEVIVETVGAGQSEYAAADLAETVLLVLQPDTGDFVQAMKSGIMEIADIYVMNKAHLPGAARSISELENLLKYVTPATANWRPRVVAIADAADVAALDRTIEDHRSTLTPDVVATRRARREALWLTSMIARRIDEVAAAGCLDTSAPRKQRYRHTLEFLTADLADSRLWG
jgi:LAO/AO transport system kinase